VSAWPPTHVIFDLDGTLLDTEPLYTQSAQQVVGRFGKVYDWSVKRLVVGGDPALGAQVIVEKLQLPISAEAYLEEREGLMRELCKTARAMPGVVELIALLRSHAIPLAIGTSSRRELCEIKLASQPFAGEFEHIVCSDDPGVLLAKPAPDIFLAAASQLRAAASDCLVFEDTTKGVQAALAAGMQVIAVPDPNMRSEDYTGARHVLDSLTQVTAALLGLS
jgi:pseudouridine-5'-monophosphatase